MSDVEVLTEELIHLREEVRRLGVVETERDLLSGNIADLRGLINQQRLEIANLREALDGMSMDMGLLEARVRELSGNELE